MHHASSNLRRSMARGPLEHNRTYRLANTHNRAQRRLRRLRRPRGASRPASSRPATPPPPRAERNTTAPGGREATTNPLFGAAPLAGARMSAEVPVTASRPRSRGGGGGGRRGGRSTGRGARGARLADSRSTPGSPELREADGRRRRRRRVVGYAVRHLICGGALVSDDDA